MKEETSLGRSCASDHLVNFQERKAHCHYPVLTVCDSPARRVVDVVVSSILLVLFAPVMIVIAILVKLDSRGPMLHSQVRVGLDRRRRHEDPFYIYLYDRRKRSSFGKHFRIYKFRSMRVDAESNGRPVWCREDDPRVTRVGAILRKTHLDELPQLFNILKGDMSFVGPRPERPEFVSELVTRIPGYRNRLLMKPGVTGLAQILHRSDQDLRDVKKKVRYDHVYLKKASSWTDLKIMVGTIPLAMGMPVKTVRQIRRNPVYTNFMRVADATASLFL